MNNREFFDNSILQYRLKNMTRKVREFESGEKYVKMQEEFQSVFRAQNLAIKKLEAELARAHAQIHDTIKKWMEACEDVCREKECALAEKDKALKTMEAKMFEALRQRDDALNRLHNKNLELYEVKIQLMEEEEKNKGLNARINRDYTNSSKPSSLSPNHKTIPNGRVKSGNKPGGQKGHIHNGRKRLEPTRTIEIPAPAEYTDSPDFKPTGRNIKKQLVRLHVSVEATDYSTPEFRNRITGQRVHAEFPKGLKDEVTYDGTVKAFAYLLNNECYVGIGKTRTFLKEISGGRLNLSTGMICSLSRQFSEKTREERDRIFLELLASPAMHADFTFGRMNGKQTAVIICATDNLVLYQGREKKGDEGVKGSPLEMYNGILISDHEASLIKHGSKHQECMAHVKRHVISSMENEKELAWNKMLAGWIEKATAYWHGLHAGSPEEPSTVTSLDAEYDAVMAKAREEYEDVPPSKYFMDGYNLYKRMSGDKESYTLFLHDPSVNPSNNLAERCARRFKRKAAQVMCFRSQEGVNRFCDGLSIIQTMKADGTNVYLSVAERFNKGLEV